MKTFMKIRILLVCGWLLMSSTASLTAAMPSSVQGTHLPAGPKIKVLLEKDVPSAFLEARGKYRVVQKDSGAILSNGVVGKRFVVHALQDGLRWGEEYPDVYQISIIPLSSETFFYVNGIQYKGAISIYHVRENHITIVNEVSIEDFLKSTLALKFDQPYTKEALAAIAIAARTEAYKKVLSGRSSSLPWDALAKDEGYLGYSVTLNENGVNVAVDWSRFMVVESVKNGGLLPNPHLSPTKADELAKLGMDAQQILKATFPFSKIGATIEADEVAIR